MVLKFLDLKELKQTLKTRKTKPKAQKYLFGFRGNPPKPKLKAVIKQIQSIM